MSCKQTEMYLENKYEEGLDKGLSDLEAEQYALNSMEDSETVALCYWKPVSADRDIHTTSCGRIASFQDEAEAMHRPEIDKYTYICSRCGGRVTA